LNDAGIEGSGRTLVGVVTEVDVDLDIDVGVPLRTR
jgi:hypothetical protein